MSEYNLIPIKYDTGDLEWLLRDYNQVFYNTAYRWYNYSKTSNPGRKRMIGDFKALRGDGLRLYGMLVQDVLAVIAEGAKIGSDYWLSTHSFVNDEGDSMVDMVILLKVVKDTLFILYTLAVPSAWIYKVASDTTYERKPMYPHLEWTIEQIKIEYPTVRYGAIEAMSKGSQNLMTKMVQKAGYTRLQTLEDFTGMEGLSLATEHELFKFPSKYYRKIPKLKLKQQQKENNKRKKQGIAFEICHMCAKQPEYMCGKIRVCSEICARKYYK